MAKSKRIGVLTKSRGTWGDIKPITKVVPDKRKVNDRNKAKRDLHNQKYSS